MVLGGPRHFSSSRSSTSSVVVAAQ
jgi:hypothetical protein